MVMAIRLLQFSCYAYARLLAVAQRSRKEAAVRSKENPEEGGENQWQRCSAAGAGAVAGSAGSRTQVALERRVPRRQKGSSGAEIHKAKAQQSVQSGSCAQQKRCVKCFEPEKQEEMPKP